MTDEVRKWHDLAEMDWRAACKLTGGDTNGAVCFHCKQCIEKLFKGCLIARAIRPPYVHDLEILSNMLTTVVAGWSANADELRLLTRGAVEMRYLDQLNLDEESRQSMEIAGRLRAELLPLLSSPPPDEV